MKTLFRFTVVSMLAGLMAAPPAFAQLEEIIVTATRREESLQDVPISVTALTGVALQQGGFSDMDDLSIFIPNLYMRDTFVGQRLAIRGIGTSPSNEAFEQAVAQFHDGVYYGRDEESTFEFGIGGPVSETFGIRVAGRAYELGDAGYVQATTDNQLGIRDNSAFRNTGVWAPTDNFELTLKFETQDVWQVGTPAASRTSGEDDMACSSVTSWGTSKQLMSYTDAVRNH